MSRQSAGAAWIIGRSVRGGRRSVAPAVTYRFRSKRVMKTILVPAGGGDTDEIVFETALAVARPFRAHLDFLHVAINPGEAAAYEPHAGFARGAALHALLARLRREGAARTIAARRRADTFCTQQDIDVGAEPGACSSVSAA